MDEIYKRCVNILRHGQTDTEKFASLLLISKTFKSDGLPDNRKSELFEAIGDDFLQRLIHSPPCAGCPSIVFKSLASAILVILATDSDLRIVEFVIKEIDFFKDVLEGNEDAATLDDVLLCISIISSQEESQKRLIEKGLLDSLSACYIKSGEEKALQLVVYLVSEEPRESWKVSIRALHQLITKLARAMQEDQTVGKFDKLQIIVSLLFHLNVDAKGEEWVSVLRDCVFELIASKPFKNYNYRESILRLACILTERLGVNWYGLEDKDLAKKSRRSVALLVHLTTIEIRMALDEPRPCTEVIQDATLLLSCYGIIEGFVSLTNDYMWEVIQDLTKQILEAITSAAASIMSFLLRVSTEMNDAPIILKDLTLASIRILCCWLSEETNALRPEVCKILPFVVQLAKESDMDDQGEVMRWLMAPLCHLSADNLTRQVLMKEGVPELLMVYFKKQWQSIMESKSSGVTLTTICGVLLNIVVMEPNHVTSEILYFDLFRFLHSALPKLSSSNSHLVLQAHFSVLGLMVGRLQAPRLKSCEVTFYKFLSSSIAFLWNAHDVRSQGRRAFLTLTDEYAAAWPDIMELWFLGLQALSGLLYVVPWIGHYLLTSGWPQKIVSSLHLVGNEDIESSIRSAYQNFLCCLVKMCPDDVVPLRELDILAVAVRHNMKELEQLLHVVDISSCQLLTAA